MCIRDSNIIEPAIGVSVVQAIACTGSEGTVADSLIVTTRGAPTVTVNPPIIRPSSQGGGRVTVSWDTKGSLDCALSGIGTPRNLGSNTVGKQLFTGLETNQTATISCPGGTRSALVNVTPNYFEE